MENIKRSFLDKTVVITGASSGVGRAAAEAFAQLGANVVIVARGQKGIDEVVEVCRSLNATAIGVSADMSVEQDVERVVGEALQINGRIDVWINNAGVMASGKFEEIPMEIHEQVIKTNLFGYMHGAYNALKIFKEQNEGILINNVSIGGFMPAPYSAVYSATKYGIRGMMECLQGEISNRRHIHICNLYPQLQNSTGNLHSAKYSGFSLSIPPIASDPRETAAKMVRLAKHPKKDTFPDFKSATITTIYKMFPKLVINTASAAVRLKMKLNKDKDGNPGNVLTHSKEPLRVYGKQPSVNANIGLAVAAGLGVGLVLFALKKKA
ncbi:short-chain dehydrogenase [Flavobacterium akiainvivens]|uniref:Short-chain dehydrogenase n=1 Tax=Flavobacterium akiainvivens TaxID=1202724 RepID=A0A0M8MKJ3_9FLAO|nr:SDR family NAD(P)-dependent oxidoreductase [Flavobacterium akiainvivens]KOS08081.1 short-chain dehydrogenase [Flavobacterium akiainvivens]SFQ71645.1 Short-chain dehydrogenase [Flavobacterium akiainvivens]